MLVEDWTGSFICCVNFFPIFFCSGRRDTLKHKHNEQSFDVLLTVHLSIILVTDQLNV